MHKTLLSDARNIPIASGSVELIITSPPYWNIKNYLCTNQIGYGQSYEKYIEDMQVVFKECFRVLKNGCRMCVNIGNKICSKKEHGRYMIMPIISQFTIDIIKKGFDFMGEILWEKHTKNKPIGSFPYPRDVVLYSNRESILIFKKQGKCKYETREQKQKSKMVNSDLQFAHSIWKIKGVNQFGRKHPAQAPTELYTRLIKMFSFESETVLDIFSGIGTLHEAAFNLRRNSIGIEKSLQYIKQQKKYNLFEEVQNGLHKNI